MKPTIQRPRLQLPPRWLEEPNGDGVGLIEINGTAYVFELIFDAGIEVGVRLTKSADGASYDVNGETMECDCPDCVYRQVQCKHSLAVAWFIEERRLKRYKPAGHSHGLPF